MFIIGIIDGGLHMNESFVQSPSLRSGHETQVVEVANGFLRYAIRLVSLIFLANGFESARVLGLCGGL